MNKIIKINYIFSNKKGTEISGQMFFPFIEGRVFKPSKIIISKGYIDLSHRYLKGQNSVQNRVKKEDLIKKHTEQNNGIKRKIKKPFILNKKPMGLVSMISLINGYNSNREASLFFDEDIYEFQKLKIAKYFQNLKSCNKDISALEIIDFREAIKIEEKYFYDLKKYYEFNLMSSSTKKMEAK